MNDYKKYNMMYKFPEIAVEEKHIVATYQVIIKTKDADKLAMAIADEQTTGTWIRVKYETEEKRAKFGGKVLSIYEIPPIDPGYVPDETCYILQIGYPMTNFSQDISMLLTTVIGNISSSGKVKMIDLSFPEEWLKGFQGPKFGIDGIREVLGVYDRPLTNCMIKPCISWTPDEGAELFYEAAMGGIDIVKDDELLSADMPYCPLEERVPKFMEMEKRAYEETGEHTLYTVNITTDPAHIKEMAYRALDLGANALMVNMYTVGLAATRMITEDPNINVPVLGHVDFSGATASSPYYGVSHNLWVGKLSRLAGVDMEIYGQPYGKFPADQLALTRGIHAFTQDWYHIKPVLALAGGGTIAPAVPYIMQMYGDDCCIAAGGGVHGHPMGSRAGAMSLRQAIDATLKGVSLREYAQDHPELKAACDVWGYGKEELLKNYDLMN
jgi:2,3-diketo-5-methylthiopentyl-1-phosphate enolase